MTYSTRETIGTLSAEERARQKRLFAHMLRKKATEAEQALWPWLRQSSGDWEFQHPLLGYIADFYSPVYRVLIELDGDSHRKTKRGDLARDRQLWEFGHHTIRFSDEQILEHPKESKERIRDFCHASSESRAAMASDWLSGSLIAEDKTVHGIRGIKKPGNTITRTICNKRMVNIASQQGGNNSYWSGDSQMITCELCIEVAARPTKRKR